MKKTSKALSRRHFLGFAAVPFLAVPIVARGGTSTSVITIGGAITEIAFALGQGSRIMARDTTSSFPADAANLPDVGYMRQLSAEGVLSFAPSLIISQEGAGPPEVIDILNSARIPFVEIPNAYDSAGIVAKIHAVGAALDVEQEAKRLAAQVESKLADAQARSKQKVSDRKRVLFILSTQGGRIMASGTGTGANGMIQMAGAENAITSFEGYKPLSDEAVTAAAPDVILMMDRTGDHASSDAELFAMPALIATPAAATKSVVRMNGLYLLGFGPRTAQAVIDLSNALYPDS